MNGSTVIDDGERIHSVLRKRIGLSRICHSIAETHGLSDKGNLLELINRFTAVSRGSCNAK